MDEVIIKSLLSPIRKAFIPPYSGSIYDWAYENVSLPLGAYAITGKFDVSLSRYLIQPFDSLLNKDVRQVNIVSGVKTGKSLVGEVWIPYIIINDTGGILKIHQTLDMARGQSKTKLMPLLRNCKPVNDLINNTLGKNDFSNTEMYFPETAIKISGPSDNVLQTFDVRYVIIEEAYKLNKNVIDQLKYRVTSFPYTSKILISSQGGEEGDALSKEFNSGIVFEWSWLCPECKNHQPYYWSKEKPESTREEPVYAGINWKEFLPRNYDKNDLETIGKAARLCCYHCTHSITDTVENRRYLNNTGKYLCVKDKGLSYIHSYTWNALANPKVSFESKVIQYLQAIRQREKTGNKDLIEIFEQKVLGKELSKYDPINIRSIITEVYDPQGTWVDECYRFMTVDYQKHLGEKWYVIRAWAKSGESRLITYGHVHTWDEIQKIATDNKVPTAFVMVDSGFNTIEVYAESVKRSVEKVIKGRKIRVPWTCLNGDGGIDYKNPDGIRRYYQETLKDPQLNSYPQYRGMKARLITWSNYSIKTILFHLKEGKGVKWSTNTTDPEYERQLNAESLEWVEDAKTGLQVQRYIKKYDDNHLLDCEAEQVLGAYMCGILGNYNSPVTNN